MKSTRLAIAARPTPRVVPFAPTHARRDEELAFLPAALEIVETPPSPTGRMIAATLMIELDPTVNAADRDHQRSDLLAEQLNIARLHAALAGGDDPMADFMPPVDADPTLVNTQRALLLHQVSEALHDARLRSRRPFRSGRCCFYEGSMTVG